MTVLTLKTDEGLLDRLASSAKKGLTKAEVESQRVSFIFAGLPEESGMTKMEIQETLSKID